MAGRTIFFWCGRAFLFVALGTALARPALAAGEFQVNTFTPGSQQPGAVAAAANGSFVVVWTSNGQDGDAYGVFGRRYDSTGAPVGIEFQASFSTIGYQSAAKVAADADGDFVVVWHQNPTAIGAFDIIGLRFSSAGVPQGAEFVVNAFTPDGQFFPAPAMADDGDFVVAWTNTNFSSDVFAQLFDASGDRVGAEFLVNTATTGVQQGAAAAMDADGDFVITWESLAADADGSDGVRGQRFASSGARLGSEFAINTYTTAGQHGSAVATDDLGGFVVVWTSYQIPGYQRDIFGQRFDSAGAPVGGEFQVNNYSAASQYTRSGPIWPPAAAMDADGDFIVVWSSASQDGSQGGSFGQRFSSVGDRLAAEFQANVSTLGTQNVPSVAAAANGDFVVVWLSLGQDGSDAGAFGRRFLFHGKTLDIDANDEVDPLTDGVLVLRRLFEFSGTTLTDGALGGGCGRCGAAAIASYIDSIEMELDVDLNQETDALTDGLLILRRLFAFSGPSLTSGALGNGCTRCDPGDIADYIDEL